jgi:hypothetical protein
MATLVRYLQHQSLFGLRLSLPQGVSFLLVCLTHTFVKNGLGGWRTTTLANGNRPEISRLPYRQLRLCQWSVVIDAHNGGVLLVFGPAVGRRTFLRRGQLR